MEAIVCCRKIIKRKIWVHSFHELNAQLSICILNLFGSKMLAHRVTKHASSVVLALGCSGGRPSSMFVIRLSSLLSMSVVTAIRVSRENPQTLDTGLLKIV